MTLFRSRQLQIMSIVLAFGCLVIFMIAGTFVRIAFGTAFEPSAALLRLMLPGAFFIGVTSIVSQYPASEGFPSSLVAAWALGVTFCTALSATLVPSYGAAGAAIA